MCIRDRYISDNSWDIVLLRYFNPVGAHESGLIGELPNGIPNNLMPYVSKVADGELDYVRVFGDDYNTPDGTGVRDYIHVVDLARGHVAAMKKLKDGSGISTYNLGTGQGYSVLDIIKACLLYTSIVSGTLIAIFVARYYGVNIYGQYTTAIAFSTFILTFTDLGLDTFMLKECSREKSKLNKYYGNVLLIKLLILIFSSILIIFLANNIGYSRDVVKLIIILIPNCVINYVINTFFVVMQIEDKLGTNAKIQILQSILIKMCIRDRYQPYSKLYTIN